MMKLQKSSKPDFSKPPSGDILLSPHHGGPILCMDNNKSNIVQGSSDHGLRVYSISTGKQTKNLFTKQYGHTEWVTTCAILPDNTVVSGGMDSNICVWDSVGVKCHYFKLHEGSVSKIIVDEFGICLSSSYDSSVRITDIYSLQPLGILSGTHKGPVTELAWNNSLAVSAGKDGLVVLWDINKQSSIFKEKLHVGQVNKILLHSDGIDKNLIITSGINDGRIIGVDMRTHEKVFSKQVHKAAINFTSSTYSNMLITGSADKSLKMFDLNDPNLKEIASSNTPDAIFCGDIYENYCVLGCGDGNIITFNLNTFECLYGYGVDTVGGVRCVKIIPEFGRIATGGDSGQGMELLV